MSQPTKQPLDPSAQRCALLEFLLREGTAVSQAQRTSWAGEPYSIPLSFAKERLWFPDRFEPNTPSTTSLARCG